MRTRFIAPAGTPMKFQHLLATASTLANRRATENALRQFASRFGVKFVFGMGSGRSALYVILKALRQIRPNRDVVAIPAYTCFSVAAAIVRSGLKIRLVDIDPETSDIDLGELEQVPPERLLCVVTSNLFGIVNDVGAIKRIAHAKGFYVVDDAAQAAGTGREAELAGTRADVGFYSLGRGKPLSAGEGGIVVTNSDAISHALQIEIERVPESSMLHEIELLFKMIATAIFLSPRLYWIPNSMKFLKLGVTEFDPSFRVAKLGTVAASLLEWSLRALPILNEGRKAKGKRMAGALERNAQFASLKARISQPSYVRFPVVAKDQATRDQAVDELWRLGIGATAFYPSAICDIPGIDRHMADTSSHCPNAEDVSRRLLTLPTHPLLTESDLCRVIDVLTRNSHLGEPSYNPASGRQTASA